MIYGIMRSFCVLKNILSENLRRHNKKTAKDGKKGSHPKHTKQTEL